MKETNNEKNKYFSGAEFQALSLLKYRTKAHEQAMKAMLRNKKERETKKL